MKRLVIVVAFAGLVAACHRGEHQGGTGTQTGTYQGTTGSEGWSGSVTNTNTVITPTPQPAQPADGMNQGGMGTGDQNQMGTGTREEFQDVQPGSDEPMDNGGATGPDSGKPDTGDPDSGEPDSGE